MKRSYFNGSTQRLDYNTILPVFKSIKQKFINEIKTSLLL